MLTPVERNSLSEQVFRQLQREILNEQYRAGDRLPSERELCDVLGVNRSSVREALKRLEQARLIEIRHGSGSVVLDFRFNAGFELVGTLVAAGGQLGPIAFRSIFEFRSLIGPEIARLAAQRIQQPELDRLEHLVDKIESCSRDDGEELQALDFEFHHTMAMASENLALVLILNSVRDVYFELREAFTAIFAENVGSQWHYRPIVDALAAHDEKRSTELCCELIELGNAAFWSSNTNGSSGSGRKEH